MSKFDEVLAKAEEQLKELGVKKIDKEKLKSVAKGLGPSIYNPDASLVSCSDEAELERVKKSSFVKKNFKLSEKKLEALVSKVCEKMKSERRKMRVVFYYLMLTEK